MGDEDVTLKSAIGDFVFAHLQNLGSREGIIELLPQAGDLGRFVIDAAAVRADDVKLRR